MKLVLDDGVSNELKEYLLSQEGIIDVKIGEKNFFTLLNIKYNEETTPNIIMKYIELFQKNKYSILYEFDKGTTGNFKTLKYVVDDLCCEYCYRNFVMDLYNNKQIKSVKSNYDYHTMSAFNIEFMIEYNKNYQEEKLIKYISNCLKN